MSISASSGNGSLSFSIEATNYGLMVRGENEGGWFLVSLDHDEIKNFIASVLRNAQWTRVGEFYIVKDGGRP